MGDFSVALGALRASADSVERSAQHIIETDWPPMEPIAFVGAAVARASTDRLAAQLSEAGADMRSWADTARAAATAFERAEGQSLR
jgi:hypothetical protein